MIDNRERSIRALDTVINHVKDGEDLRTKVIDILADIMHMCGRNGIDFQDCLRIATYHYEEEKADG